MLAAALEAEVAAYIAAHAAERDENGRRLVVRNGHARPRQVDDGRRGGGGPAPRVNDRRVDGATGERGRFRSAILPPWCRKSPKITEVLPLLYLHGLSSKDFVPALEQFLGSPAGLSRLGDHPADRGLAGGVPALVREGPVRRGLRVLLGRRAALRRAA